MTIIALTRRPSPALQACQLTYIQRQPIDYARAVDQHRDYCQALEKCGAEVITLLADSSLPDGVFVEDCAIILDEIAVITSMGNEVRRAEVQSIVVEVARFRSLSRISPPATIEGGDVLRIGRTLFVGHSARTNPAGIEALRAIVQPYGYQVVPVAVHGCLHLKTGCTALDGETVLMNTAWVDQEAFRALKILSLPPEEPWGANVLPVGGRLCVNSAFPRTLELIQRLGYTIQPVDISEFLKAEAGLTCLSLLIRSGKRILELL